VKWLIDSAGTGQKWVKPGHDGVVEKERAINFAYTTPLPQSSAPALLHLAHIPYALEQEGV
jgi:hypothetical protein